METEVRKLDGDTLVKLGEIADNAKDILGVVESMREDDDLGCGSGLLREDGACRDGWW